MHMKSDSSGSLSSVSVSAKPRNRQVSSQFMSPSHASTGSLETGFSSSPTEALSPVRHKTGFSSSLADHISKDRLRDREHLHHHHDREKPTKTTGSVFSLARQKSCKELKNENGSKENDRPLIAGSARNIGKFTFPGKSSSSSSSTISPSCSVKKQSSHDSCIDQRRLSLDENALYKKFLFSSRRNPDCSIMSSVESEPGCFSSPSGTIASRKLGREVSSKYVLSDVARRVPRWTSDSDASNPSSFDESMMTMKKCTVQKNSSTKRVNSLTGYKSSMSQWALSPGRSGSPTMCVESKEKLPLSFSSLRPPNNSMEKILSMGFDLFRRRKSSSLTKSSVGSEDVHVLRFLDNRLVQWRFANARAQAVKENISHQAESNLIFALDGLTKLRHSVMQKKIQLEMEKLKVKLSFVLHSHMKLLETWGGMERQHLVAIAMMEECLHSVVCKVPLLEGAKVDIQSASIAQRQASDLIATIKSALTSFSPLANKTAELLSELAEVVAQEKLILEEFYDLFRTICALELKERSLKCSLIQLQY